MGSEKSVLVTGANGFIGSAVVRRLASEGYEVLAAARRGLSGLPANVRPLRVADLAGEHEWDETVLSQIDAVVHTAGRAHVLHETAADPLAEFRKVNVEGTLRLARAAAASGVRRFVFLSTVGVNGAQTPPGRPFTEQSPPSPQTPYAISKLEAERALLALAEQSGVEVVIIRPPLVYGPAAPGNFGRLAKAVAKGIPMPLGMVRNKRSFVALANLVDFISLTLRHPAAANQIFLVSDDADLSTAELIAILARKLGRRPSLVPVPQPLLVAALRLVGKGDLAVRLCAHLQVDISKAKTVLGWRPPVSPDEALGEVARWLLEANK